MCMSLSRRLQILLDEEQHARLTQRAKTEGRSVGALIREAIDLVWTGPNLSKAALLEEILAAGPMPVPEPDELKREIQQMYDERSSNY